MKLEAFRIQNYKNITDTDWVSCAEMTAFVGKNEAGKTALFRGLSKLKPTDGEKYDKLKEFPRSRLTSDGDARDWPVATGRFALIADESNKLAKICPALPEVKHVEVTRYYSDQVEVEYNPVAKLPEVTAEEWLESLTAAEKDVQSATAPGEQAEALKQIKLVIINGLNPLLESARNKFPVPTLDQVRNIQQVVNGQLNEEWSRQAIAKIVEPWADFEERLRQRESLKAANDWIVEQMPFFLYFDNYGVLQSDIFLPDFLTKVDREDAGQQIRVQRAIFKHVGVDIKSLAALGKHQAEKPESEAVKRQIDELTIRCDAASQRMTEKFKDWWEQRRHAFSYELHGNYFRIWVMDDRDPSKIELEERSAGMRYFFSFYLVFLVEAEELHRNCILLLDEPGLHLHATAQAKLIKFFEKLSQQNQLFYSTHSPFMIDGDHLERVRALSESDRGLVVSSDVWPRDRDTVFPLQAALGYSICQSLFLSRKQVLVEGPTDYVLLTAINVHLRTNGRNGLNADTVMLPMGGTKCLMPLASMLVGNDIEIAIVLDSDTAGLSAQKRIKDLLPTFDERCVQIRQCVDDVYATELEDLIPEETYLAAVREAYPKVALEFSDEEREIENVADRVAALFDRNGDPLFEKWRPIDVLVQLIHRSPENVPVELFEAGERIFARLNQIFSDPGPPIMSKASAPLNSVGKRTGTRGGHRPRDIAGAVGIRKGDKSV